MKLVPKVQNWELLDHVQSRGSFSNRNYRSVGLHRGWEDVLIGRIDSRMEKRRKELEKQIEKLIGKDTGKKPAA